MRKALIVMSLLAALSVGGIATVYVTVNGQKDQVVITEEVLFGDKAAAEGLSVRGSANMDGHLHWDTTYTIGAEPVTRTDYRFTSYSQYKSSPYEPMGLRLDATSPLSYLSERWHQSVDGTDLTGWERAYWDLFQDTPPGEEKEITVRVKDYYDYYDTYIQLELNDYLLDEVEVETRRYYDSEFEEQAVEMERLIRKLKESFKIPVLPTETRDIHIRKHEDGNLSGYGSGTGNSDRYDMQVYNALTEDACYFIVDNRSYKGAIMDFSQTPEGYGIYTLPIRRSPDQLTGVDVEGLSMVYPMEEESRVFWFTPETDRERLLLLTIEEGEEYRLRVIDCDEMETVQEIWFSDLGRGRKPNQIVCRDGYLVIRTDDGGVMVLEERDGLYELGIDVPITQEEHLIYGIGATLWDGERLAMAAETWYEDRSNGNTSGFVVAIYDAQGAAFGAKYTSSLDTGNYGYGHSETCELDGEEFLKLAWTN